jgi:hypothetical protein
MPNASLASVEGIQFLANVGYRTLVVHLCLFPDLALGNRRFLLSPEPRKHFRPATPHFFFGPHLELVLETNGIDSPLNNAECQTMNSAISFLLHRLQNST